MRPTGLPSDDTPTAFWLALLLLALAVYAFGLGGQYIPSNGDEMVYAHIARATAETGRWLPLASELVDTRNTKPPLLIWQAMMAGGWGEHWTLAALRTPSLLYTLLTAAAVGWTVWRLQRAPSSALLAACLYLAFFSTFRYSRPYLTSAPETFWLSLPLFALLWQRGALRPLGSAAPPPSGPGWTHHVLLGLGLGLGLAYKSFALIAPAAAAWWLALVLSEGSPRHMLWRAALRHALRTGVSAMLALGVFALWFALDPEPAEIWREFIVAENAAKFADRRGYWQEALSLGGSSLWSQSLAYAVNAGLLACVVLGLAWLGLRGRPQGRRVASPVMAWPTHLLILLAWAGIWLLVFMVPSQRSARYVIPAMPAIAILLALYWPRIGRGWFIPGLLLTALALPLLARVAWIGHELRLFTPVELVLALGVMALTALVMGAALLRPAWTRALAVLATLLLYASMNLTLAPMDGPRGRYAAEAAQSLGPSARVAAPSDFNGQFERFRFLLPGRHRLQPYRPLDNLGDSTQDSARQLQALLATHDAVIWTQSAREADQPSCLAAGCRVLGERWLLKSRHQRDEVRLDNLWQPQEWLFRREWLLSQPAQRAP